ncbi:YicC/YloC family endoribonuclease [Roseobacteraceae bacterium S113]
MTGFAAAEGQFEVFNWSWELRSVNGRGLDVRLRVPDWVSGLEMALRKRLGAALGRGNVTLNLRLGRAGSDTAPRVNPVMLEAMLTALGEVEAMAMGQGQSLAPATAADVLALRGVLDTSEATTDAEGVAALLTALLADFEPVLDSFLATRAQEGAALHAMISGHLDEIADLTIAAGRAAEARRGPAQEALRAALARVGQNVEDIPEERVAQELALLAVKADVTEELDRLAAHVDAARDLLATSGPIGRRFDFLMQEFNREANTLCSKSGDTELTNIGLSLKTKIDQLREQVQNVE